MAEHMMVNEKSGRVYLVLRIVVTVISVAGVIFFFIPIIKNYYIFTTAFMTAVCAFPGLWVNIYPSIKKRKMRKTTLLMFALIALFTVLLFWLVIMGSRILGVKYETPPKNATVVVLGAKVYEDSISQSLQNRLDAALSYLSENPESKCIVTGGQGNDEPRTEASAEKEYLVSKGIAEERIILEDKSTSTEENLSFAKELLPKEERTIVIATQGFHQFRSRCMAKDLGFTVYSVKAATNPYMYPSYLAREMLALTQYYLNKSM